MTGYGSKPNIGLLVGLILLTITIGIITLNVIKGMEDKVKIDIEIEEVTMEDFLSGDENIPTLEFWLPVMPDKTITILSEDMRHISC